MKNLPSWRQTWLQEGEILYIAKKGGANFGAQEGGTKNIFFTEGEPTLAPKSVGTKIFFFTEGEPTLAPRREGLKIFFL